MLKLCLAAPLLAALLPAQAPFLSYPQDALDSNSGNLVPFGFNGINGSADEGRFQQLIPAPYLPSTGALIVGMEVYTIPGTGTVTYQSLDITLGHSSGSSLSTTFANNLIGPVAVLQETNKQITWSQSQWVAIPFTTPFPYNGVDALVIDMQKVVASYGGIVILSHGTSDHPGRTDLPFPRYSFGALGSGASTASTASFASATVLNMRLWVTTPALSVKSDQGGLNSNRFAIGGTAEIAVRGNQGTLFATLLGGAFGPGTTFSPVPGTFWLSAGAPTMKVAVIGASGLDLTVAGIPNNPALVGLRASLQSAYLDISQGTLGWTNATDFTLNN